MSDERLRYPICHYPVAYVKNDVSQPIHTGWGEIVSELVVEPKLAAGLDGIEGFSHLLVLFAIHGVSAERRRELRLHPRDRSDLPLVGVFATRSQYRPNPIGATIVRLIERRANVLLVRGLDAIDGTPVLDVKPHVPETRLIEPVKVPDWVLALEAAQK